MFRALLRTRLRALIYSLAARGRKRRVGVGGKIGFAILAIYLLIVFVGMFGSYFFQLCEPYHRSGIDWLYFAMAGIFSLAFMFVGSVFTTQTQLYEARDNELLLAMPIPPSYILASRMGMLLILNMAFNLLIAFPAGIVYVLRVGANPGGVVRFVVVFLLLPFLGLALSSIVGYVVAAIAGRVRNKSLMTTTLFLIFFAIYFAFIFRINAYIQKLVDHGNEIAGRWRQSLRPLYWLGSGIAEGNLFHFFLTILMLLVPFGIVYVVLSRTFLHVVTRKRGFAKRVYREQKWRVTAPDVAMIRKDGRHFLASPMYLLNGGLGLLFLLIGAVVLLIKQGAILEMMDQIPQMQGAMMPLCVLFICLLTSMCLIAAPSISLEGKYLWIAQSLPIRGREILVGKAKLQIYLCLPFILLAELAVALVFKPDILSLIGLILVPIAYNLFAGLMGVEINLRFPNFDWLSESEPVKRGMSVFAAMIVGMAAIALPAALYGLLLARLLAVGYALLVYALLLGLISWWMYRHLWRKGDRLFAELG